MIRFKAALGLRYAGDRGRNSFTICHRLQYVTISKDSDPVEIAEEVIFQWGIDCLVKHGNCSKGSLAASLGPYTTPSFHTYELTTASYL